MFSDITLAPGKLSGCKSIILQDLVCIIAPYQQLQDAHCPQWTGENLYEQVFPKSFNRSLDTGTYCGFSIKMANLTQSFLS